MKEQMIKALENKLGKTKNAELKKAIQDKIDTIKSDKPVVK